jgi:hypothetical protein
LPDTTEKNGGVSYLNYISRAFASYKLKLEFVGILASVIALIIAAYAAIMDLKNLQLFILTIITILFLIFFFLINLHKQSLKRCTSDLKDTITKFNELQDKQKEFEQIDAKRLYNINAKMFGATKDAYNVESELFEDGHIESKISMTIRAV